MFLNPCFCRKREAKQAKNQPIVTSVLRPVVLIAVQTPLPPAQQTQLPTLKPKSLKTGEDTDQKGTSIDICQNLMNVKVPNLAKQDVVIQTDIYGVDTLALSSKAGPEGSLYEGRQNTQTSQQLHGNTDKIVKSDVKSLKSPQKRFTLGKRRMSQSGCMNPSSPRRKKAKSTTGMQTSVSFTRKKGVPTVNSTQTTGDFILQTAMKHANIQIQKKTVASQVTPQKCGSVQESEVKSSEMQTFISGFKPQLVDSSSQVYNILAESETMTEMPLSTSTQTLQSYLESQQEKLEEKIIDRAQENIKCDENKSLRKSLSASSETMVQIYNETLDSSVSFVVPASNKMPDKNEHENKTKAVVRERDELPDGEMLTAVKLVKSQIVLHSPNDKDPSSNNENIAVHLMKMQDAGAHQLTEDTLFEENYLAGQSHMTDMEAQTMSFSEFDLLLQSSGIFLNGSNFLQCPSSQISPRAGPDENKDFITQAHSPDLDFLSVGTSTMDMNTQTASDLNLFDTYVPIDSNTQTGGEVDFLDLVMSNMETQTLNDDDFVSLGLLDSNLPSSSMQNMSVGTSDFDVDNSELPSASPTKYSFKNGHIAGSSKETSVSTRFLNNAAMLQTGSESVGENKASAQQTVDRHKTNQTGSMPLTDTHQKETVQMETQTLTSDYSENMGQSLMENQTQVELEDTAFMTINMETQTTFDDLQEFCEMLQ